MSKRNSHVIFVNLFQQFYVCCCILYILAISATIYMIVFLYIYRFMESFMHLLKCSLSTGLLSVPNGFSNVGLGLGIIGTLAGGVLITHCVHVLIQSQYRQSKRLRVPVLSYQDTISTALATGPENFRQCACPLGISVILFLLVINLGMCCVIIFHVAQSMKRVIDTHFVISLEVYMILIMFPCVGVNLLKDLKALAPISTLANTLTLIGYLVYMYVIKVVPKPSDAPLQMFRHFIEFPQFFGAILFSFTSVGAVVAVENDMLEPKRFTSRYGVLNMSMFALIIVHLLVGIVGYNFCREKCTPSMPLDMPAEYWLADISILFFSLGQLFSYGLYCYVPIQLVWGFIEHELPLETPKKKRKVLLVILRLGLCFLTFIMAIVIPGLHLFISLIGAVSISALALIFPAVMNVIWTSNILVRIKDVIVILIGLVIMMLGCYKALNTIVANYMG